MSRPSRYQLTHDKLLPFQGLHGIDGLCHVRVYEQDGRLPVAIVGELDDNPGTKISKGTPMVAHAVRQEFFADGREFLLVEHHPDSLFDRGQPTFELVHHDHGNQATIGRRIEGDFRDPGWSEIQDIEGLTGCPVRTWPKGRYTARAAAGLRGEYLRCEVAARGRTACDRLMAILAER